MFRRSLFFLMILLVAVPASAKSKSFPEAQRTAFLTAGPQPSYPPLALAMRISGSDLLDISAMAYGYEHWAVSKTVLIRDFKNRAIKQPGS